MDPYGNVSYSRKPAWFLVLVLLIVVACGILSSFSGQSPANRGDSPKLNYDPIAPAQQEPPQPTVTLIPATPAAFQTMAVEEKRLALEQERLELARQRQSATARAQQDENAYHSTQVANARRQWEIAKDQSDQRVVEQKQQQATNFSYAILALAAALALAVALLAVWGVTRAVWEAYRREREAETARLSQQQKLFAEHNRRVEAARRRSQARHALRQGVTGNGSDVNTGAAGSNGGVSTKQWPAKAAQDTDCPDSLRTKR